MPVYAIVEGGVVVNTIVWDGTGGWSPVSGTAVACDSTVAVGWTFDGTSFAAPLPSPPPLRPLARWRFMAGLDQAGLLSSVPAVIAAIPDAGARAVAAAKFSHATELERDDPTLVGLATALGLDAGELDALWRSAAAL